MFQIVWNFNRIDDETGLQRIMLNNDLRDALGSPVALFGDSITFMWNEGGPTITFTCMPSHSQHLVDFSHSLFEVPTLAKFDSCDLSGATRLSASSTSCVLS